MSGTYTFRWDRPASEVYVTGTFDGWSRREKLKQTGDVFEKNVELPAEKTLYKFVVDGNWVIDPNASIETDESGIQNNILLPAEIQQPENEMSQAAISSVSPQSTTAELAGAVPKEQSNGHANGAAISSAAPDSTTAELASKVPLATPGAGDVPGGFPETPATESEKNFSVNPLPGGFPETSATKSEQTFSVNPLPASDTAENPINLKSGEPVPTNVGTQSVNSNVHLDKESYEKGATNFPLSQLLPEVVTPAEKREAEGRGILDLPKNLIPESVLPITSSAEAKASKESEPEVKEVHVPEIVKESQEKAHFDPEASAVPEVVEEKAEVESELKSKVPEKPPVSEGNTVIDQAKAAVTSTFSTVTAAVGLGSKAPEQPTEPVDKVPKVVKESLAEAGAPAEAAAVEESVEHKKEVEEELKTELEAKKSVPQENAEQTKEQKEPVVTNGISSSTTTAHDQNLRPTEDAEVKSTYDDAVEEHPTTAEPVKTTENGVKSVEAEESKPAEDGDSAPKKSLESATSKHSKSSSKKGRRRSIFGRLLGRIFH